MGDRMAFEDGYFILETVDFEFQGDRFLDFPIIKFEITAVAILVILSEAAEFPQERFVVGI